MRAMSPGGLWPIPDLVAAHRTELEAATELAAEEALLRLGKVRLDDAGLGGGDAVEDAEDDGARERDVEVLDDEHVLVDAAGGHVGRQGPGEVREGVGAVAGVVGGQEGAGGAQRGRRHGHVGPAVFGQDVVVAREELARAVGAIFGTGQEPAYGGAEEGHFWTGVLLLDRRVVFSVFEVRWIRGEVDGNGTDSRFRSGC